MKILYWPNGCWCEESDLHQMSHKSDDFASFTVHDSDGVTDDEIDKFVQTLISQ